jgi:hypothetical protein
MSSILTIESQRITMKSHPLILKCKEAVIAVGSQFLTEGMVAKYQ